MVNWPFSDDALRAMYRGGKANATARRFSRLWATVFGWGLQPKRWVTLEVSGRISRRITRFPLGMAQSDGQWHLVSMLGDDCNWVKNVRAADGTVILRRRHAQECHLIEVPPQERAPIIKRYLAQVRGARPHIPVDRRSTRADFETIAEKYPVFLVTSASAQGGTRPGQSDISGNHPLSYEIDRRIRWLGRSSAMTKLGRRESMIKFFDFFNWTDSPWAGLTQIRLAPTFRLEHYAEDGRFVVRAELPGLDVDKNIDVTARDGILRIRAERQEERKDGQRSEFRYGSLTRSVELPRHAEVDKITASYDNGILRIVVPLSQAEPADQRIEITSAS